eukprot:Lithocolla_globosa_v1_NODE_2088_length_2175_cov_17.604245.p2 type:complete len:179 gc:universal NODE_2088_length_2175_cov_17.604245:692-156(-)
MPRGIIYCRTLEDTMDIYCWLKAVLGPLMFEDGQPATYQHSHIDYFHAVVEEDVKEALGERFMRESTLRILIATIAFGMGLDPKNASWVVNWGTPKDVEAYVQETCRAGRDGTQATAIMYDVCGQRQHGQLNREPAMTDYLETDGCRQNCLAKEFDNRIPFNCDTCDNCKKRMHDNIA